MTHIDYDSDPAKLYGLKTVAQAKKENRGVVLCRRDTDVQAFRSLGLTCTYWPTEPAFPEAEPPPGAPISAEWDDRWDQLFKGMRVYVLTIPRDRAKAELVAMRLHPIAAKLWLVTLPTLNGSDLPEACFWVQDGGTAEGLKQLIATQKPWHPPRRTDPSALTGAQDIRARLWTVEQEKLGATERYRKQAATVLEWLHERGKFYFDTSRRDFAAVMFFDTARALLLPVQGDAFLAWLSDNLGLNRAERGFAFIAAAIETEGLSDRSTPIEPAAYWASRPRACYLSSGPGSMVRVAPNSIETVANGTDGVLFPYGATLVPWKLTEPVDPFTTCAIFADLSTAAPHGKELLKLWMLSLPTDPACKPPLCVSAPVGGGKTACIRGIFRIFGIPDQINAVTKTGDSDFWTTLDAGGLVCFDNCDTRIDWLPDALAAAATAGTHQKRKLYTDSDRVTLRSKAWIAITSASPTFAADAGLADRLLVVRLNRRDGETAESALFAEVDRNRDAALSWICHTLAIALADTAEVPLGLNHRHPDFSALGVRIGRALGAEPDAVAALKAAEADKGLFNLENDTVGAALIELLRVDPFSGTAGVLLERLVAIEPAFAGRLSAKRLAKRLAKLWPHLHSVFHASSRRDDYLNAIVYTFQPPTKPPQSSGIESDFEPNLEPRAGAQGSLEIPETLPDARELED